MSLTTRISKFRGALNVGFSASNLTPCMTAVGRLLPVDPLRTGHSSSHKG
jgi:hypothetical protein